MHLSIIIVNWNTTSLLEACIASVFREAPEFDFEVIVVDNASRDFDLSRMKGKYPEVRFIANCENFGYAKGNNQAINAATGDYLLLLNPDTEMQNNGITSLVKYMEAHPEAAAAGCRLVRPDGTVEKSVRGFPEPSAVAAEFTRLSKLLPNNPGIGAYRMNHFTYTVESEVDQPMGSCLILSGKAVKEIGTLDESFPIFFNEVDWCYRAKQAGWKIYFTPSVEVIHHGGSSTKQIRHQMRRESHRSLARFYKKHYKKRMFFLAYWSIMAAIWLSDVIEYNIHGLIRKHR